MPRKGGTQIVLIADDNDDTLELLARLLENEPYEVITAMDGQLALDKFYEVKNAGDCVDLMILDYEMPHLKGVTVAQQLHDAGEQVETVLLTGSSDPILTVRRQAAGITRRWDKPANPDELKANIRTILRLRRAAN